jgi:hypothetical protein
MTLHDAITKAQQEIGEAHAALLRNREQDEQRLKGAREACQALSNDLLDALSFLKGHACKPDTEFVVGRVALRVGTNRAEFRSGVAESREYVRLVIDNGRDHELVDFDVRWREGVFGSILALLPGMADKPLTMAEAVLIAADEVKERLALED